MLSPEIISRRWREEIKNKEYKLRSNYHLRDKKKANIKSYDFLTADFAYSENKVTMCDVLVPNDESLPLGKWGIS